jgi:hypothetical protein
MTLDTILDELPNGLKDARLERVDVQLERDRIVLTLSIWMGDERTSEGMAREIYQRAQITLDGLRYVIVPPGALTEKPARGWLEVDGDVEPSEDHETELPELVPELALSLYLSERNRFLHFGAKKGDLRWLDDATRE